MLPHHYNPGQPGIPQQALGPQGQPDQHAHTVPGVTNADELRMWQQMHMQRLRQQQGVGDLTGGQGANPQVSTSFDSSGVPVYPTLRTANTYTHFSHAHHRTH